jgi:hypothetical protein
MVRGGETRGLWHMVMVGGGRRVCVATRFARCCRSVGMVKQDSLQKQVVERMSLE